MIAAVELSNSPGYGVTVRLRVTDHNLQLVPVRCHARAALARVFFGGVLTAEYAATHTVYMKRANLVLDEQLLKEATRLAEGRTYSGTVNLALLDLVRRARARRILDLAGTGAWGGDLATMRADVPRASKGKR